MALQKFDDVVKSMRESTYSGEQVQAEELVGEKFAIKQCKIGADDRGEWGDVQVEHKGKEQTFITGSGPLKDAIKTIVAKQLLKAGPIESTILKVKSKNNPRQQYYQFGNAE